MSLTATTSGVLFDLDGTLIHSRPALVAAYRAAFLEVLGKSFPALESDPERFLTPRVWEVCTAIAGDRAAECVEAYDRHYRADTYRLVHPYEGILEMLATLQRRGVRTGIVTNKGRSRTEMDLAWVGIDPESMSAIVCAEDTVERKPHPAPVALGLSIAALEPNTAIYVGDGPQDARSGRAAGTSTISVLYGYYGEEALRAAEPDHVAATSADLAQLLIGGSA